MNNMQGHDGSSGGEPTLQKLQLHLLLALCIWLLISYREGTHPSSKATPSKLEGSDSALSTQHSAADTTHGVCE